MTARLPTPGSDDGAWGDILNEFLGVTHASDGTLDSGVVGTNQLQDSAVSSAKLDSSTQASIASAAGKYTKPSGGIPILDLDSTVVSYLSDAQTAVQNVNGKVGTSVSLNIDDLANISTGGATDGQVLAKSGSVWSPTSVAPTASPVFTGSPATSVNGNHVPIGFQGNLYDLRSFIGPGQALDNTGATTASNAEVINAAVTALSTTTIPVQIFIPNGTYKLDAVINMASLVGIKGETERGTVLMPTGANSCILKGSPTFYDNVFETFTIDGSLQTSPTYTTNIKGFNFPGTTRAKLKHVTVQNCWATGIAFDSATNCVMDHPTAINNGRQVAALSLNPDTTSGSSGIGIGLGYAPQTEPFLIINPMLFNNGRAGLFFETQKPADGTTYQQEQGLKVVGGIAMGNYVGWYDAGCAGAEVNMKCIYNTCNGVRIDGTVLTDFGGIGGRYSGECAYNGTSGNAMSAGVWLGSGTGGALNYTIEGSIHDNVNGPGVGTGMSAATSLNSVISNITINANIYNNAASGVIIQGNGLSGGVISSVAISGRCCNNGQDASQTYRDGVTVLSSTDLLTVAGILTDNEATPKQQHGLQTLGAGLTANRVNFTADVRGNAVSPWNNTQTVNGNLALVGSDTSGPSNLMVTSSASSGGGQVALSWTPPIPSNTVTDYSIEYSVSGLNSWSTFSHSASTATSRTVTGLTNGTAYDFQVAAVVGGVTGSYTAGPVTATPTTQPLLSDTFQRTAVQGSVGSTDGGSLSAQAWTVLNFNGVGSNTCGIHTNATPPPATYVRGDTSTSPSRALLYVDPANANGRHQATLASVDANSTNTSIGLAFRIQDNANFWYVAIRKNGSGSNEYALQYYSAASLAVVLDLNTVPAKGDVITVLDNVTSILVYINGTLKGTYSGGAVSNFSSATKTGFLTDFNGASATGFAYWSYAIN